MGVRVSFRRLVIDKMTVKPLTKMSLSAEPLTVRPIVWVLGIILLAIHAVWLVQGEVLWRSVHASVLALPFNALTSLMVLKAMNFLLGRWRLRLTELLSLYVLLAMATTFFAFDQLQGLLPGIVYPFRYASPENYWSELFLPYLPRWLVVSDREAVRAFYEGNSSWQFYWRAWALPFAAWHLFLLCGVGLWTVLNLMTFRHWHERERLTYPLARFVWESINLPKQLSWRFVAGAFLGSLPDLSRGLRTWFPFIPSLMPAVDLTAFFHSIGRPWDVLEVPLHIYPFVIGLTFLMPLDLAFSLWLFFGYWQGQLLLRNALGLNVRTVRFPNQSEESVGAWLIIGAMTLWKVVKDAKCDTAIYRWATLAFLFFLIQVAFLRAMGIPFAFAFAVAAFLTLIALAVTRLRVELGPPAHELFFVGPDELLPKILGVSALPRSALIAFSLLFWFTQNPRSHFMPMQQESMALLHWSKAPLSTWFMATLIASLMAPWFFAFAYWRIFYRYGLTNALGYMHTAWMPWQRLQQWLTHPDPPDWSIGSRIGQGIGIAILLTHLRLRWPGFPLHPAGYALSGNWTFGWMWFSVFCGWLAKSVLVRYGGLMAFRAALPFFIGMTVGQLIAGAFWSLVGIIAKRPMNILFP